MTNNLISLGCIAVIILAGNMAIQYHEFVFAISGSMVLAKTRQRHDFVLQVFQCCIVSRSLDIR